MARSPNRKDRALFRLFPVFIPAIRARNFIQPQAALSAIQIPFQRREHVANSVRAHLRRIFRQRICDVYRRVAFRAEHCVHCRIDKWNRKNFLITESRKPLAQTVFVACMRQPRGSCSRYRQSRREFVEAIMPHDLFNQIYFARHIRAPRWLAAFPHRIRRICSALVGALRRKAERFQDRLNFRLRHIRAHHSQEFTTREQQHARLRSSWINIHHAREHFAARHLLN